MSALEPYSKDHPDRVEHTQLGAMIGGLRDEWLGRPVTDDDRQQQARFNDEMAHVAADVVACLPQIRWFGAGTLRAIALNDPNCTDSAAGLVGMAANFAGGAGMNVIARSGSFGLVQKATAQEFGFGLRGEAATHFATGVQLGAVRSLTDMREWVGDDGKLRMANMGDAVRMGLVSGVANVPAGFVGSRIMMLGGQSAFSRVAGGTLSGSVSGGMFGGTDAFLRTGDLERTWEGMSNGALTGAIAGGVTAGAERGRQELFYAVANKWRKPPVDQVTTGAVLTDTPLSENAQRLLTEQPERFAMKNDSRSLAQLSQQLGPGRESSYYQEMMYPQGPTKFWSDAQYRLNVMRPLRSAVAYEYGGTVIKVPAEYARQLEPVRALRLAAESGDRNAARDLGMHALGDRLLPEDLVPLLDRLPNQQKMKQVQLLGNRNAWDGWYKEFTDYGRVSAQKGGSFVSTADANRSTGEVRLFSTAARTGGRKDIGQVMDHEQVHLNHEPLYRTAREVDAPVEASKYGWANKLESEAELESFAFWGTPQTFLEATEQAPVRMSLLARKLNGTLNNSSNNGGTQADALRERIDYVLQNAVPVANEKLMKVATGKDATQWQRRDVTDLYQRINNTMDEAMVQRLISEQQKVGD